MKKIILLTAALLSALALSACNNEAAKPLTDGSLQLSYAETSDETNKNFEIQGNIIEETEFTYQINNVSVFDDDIYFTVDDEDYNATPARNSTLYKASKNGVFLEKCFEFPNGSDYTGNVFVIDGTLVYDSVGYYKLLAYDTKTMEEKPELAIPDSSFMRTYSHDMQTVIDFTEEGMLLEDLSPENEQMSEFIFTPDEGQYRYYDWSDDCSKIVLSNYIDEIMTLDIEEKYPFKVDVDGIENALPSTLVDFGQCLVNSNGEVGINALCEDGAVIVLTDFYGKYMTTIASEWDASIVDMNNEFVLYLVKNQDGLMEIDLYNLAEKTTTTLVSSKTEKITDASLDGHSVIYSGFDENTTFVRSIKF